jgi:hypothetical protein
MNDEMLIIDLRIIIYKNHSVENDGLLLQLSLYFSMGQEERRGI